jgi:alkanesulfonate monooxygenase SsuD/methylene tetrahydromethanopterin reductase-like flavin-dependent oxidoreductase (luciferase family)
MFHPGGLQELLDLALEEDEELGSNNMTKIEEEADLVLSNDLTPEEAFVKTLEFARHHGRDISRSGLYKIESGWNIVIFLADSEEEASMRIEEAIRG